MATPQGLSFYANGVNLAGALTSFEPTAEVESLDATVLDSSYRAYQAGFKTGNVSASGLFDYDQTNLNKIHNVMSAAFDDRSELIVTTSLVALAVGGDAILLNPTVAKYGIETPLSQLITVSLELMSNNAINFGKWLMSGTVTNTTTNGTAVDNGAATTNGGIGHAHIQNSSGNDVNVVWQHSTNNSTWVDLGEEDISGTLNAASLIVAAGTTVNRYLRAVVTTTGGASAVQVAFARR